MKIPRLSINQKLPADDIKILRNKSTHCTFVDFFTFIQKYLQGVIYNTLKLVFISLHSFDIVEKKSCWKLQHLRFCFLFNDDFVQFVNIFCSDC
jgi:hypothetical protein